MKRLRNIALLLSLLSATMVTLAYEFTGKSLQQAIAELEAQGLPVLYSSDLVKAEMSIARTPTAHSPRAILEEIVQPHGIQVVEGPAGLLLLTRARPVEPSVAPSGGAPNISEVLVTASRYEWVRIPQPSLTRLSEAELHLAPNVGDDPVRTFARLPGMATTDLSAKLNIRGGVADEVLVRFDGLRLINPFHLKDFQSIFSAIDPALIGAVDIYTGGFPVSFGDRMSGVVDIHPVRADGATHGEIALSLFNGSALGSGRFDRGRGDWMISARRGNLDRVLDWSGMKLGEPAYSDIHARLGHRINDSMALSANLLRFDDDIELSDSDVEEQARARYRDRYLWLRLDAHPRESLTGSTIIARTDIESVRTGAAEQPGISQGTLDDRREFAIQSVQTDWSWQAPNDLMLLFGGEWRHSDGRYHYRDAAELDLLIEIPGAPNESSRAREIDHHANGDQYGAYVGLRTEVAPPLMLEGGLRWDRSTLSQAGDAWSPRASALYRLSESSSVRASWGRFVQNQGIDELPISDGVSVFQPPQRADHWLVSFEQRLGPDLDLRIEGYRKRYSQLSPRFENLLNNIVLLPELKPDRIRIAPTRARATGVEISLRSVRSRPLFWWASYTWSRAEDLLSDRTVRRSWDQEHSFNAGLGWESELWELSVAGAWHSGRPTTTLALIAADDESAMTVGVSDTRRLKSYIGVDVRIARRFHFDDDDSLTAFFEIRNVLNRRNDCCTEFEIDDESGQPELVVESIRSLPLLPSLGVIWRF